MKTYREQKILNVVSAAELFHVLIIGGKGVTGVVCLFKMHPRVLRAKVRVWIFLMSRINKINLPVVQCKWPLSHTLYAPNGDTRTLCDP